MFGLFKKTPPRLIALVQANTTWTDSNDKASGEYTYGCWWLYEDDKGRRSVVYKTYGRVPQYTNLSNFHEETKRLVEMWKDRAISLNRIKAYNKYVTDYTEPSVKQEDNVYTLDFNKTNED